MIARLIAARLLDWTAAVLTGIGKVLVVAAFFAALGGEAAEVAADRMRR